MADSVQQLVSDPQFAQLSVPDQIAVLSKADPTFAQLSGGDQLQVLTKIHGGTNTPAPPPQVQPSPPKGFAETLAALASGLMNPNDQAGQQAWGDVGSGIFKGLGETAQGLYNAADWTANAINRTLGTSEYHPQAELNPAAPPPSFEQVQRAKLNNIYNLQSKNPAQSIGKGLETVGEFALGDEALSGLAKMATLPEPLLALIERYPKAARLLAATTKNAALGAAQGGLKASGSGEGAAEGAISGAEGGALGGAAGEALPMVASSLGKGLERIAPKSMNALLKANRASNFLYGKNPGRAFIDEAITPPMNSVTFHGQLENLSDQLDTAAAKLSGQLDDILSQPDVASKRLNVVPVIKQAVNDARANVASQTGLDTPKYLKALNGLEDNLLDRYDAQGNSLGRLTSTRLSPAETSDVKTSIGRNTDWVTKADDEYKLKTFLNGVRRRVYGKLADMVEASAPDANVKQLNMRLANVLEAKGLLDKRIAVEAGTGKMGAFLRHGELGGALLALMTHGATGDAGLATAALLSLDAARRTPAARVATSRVAAATGSSLTRGAGQAASQVAGRAAKLFGGTAGSRKSTETEEQQ